MGCCGSIPAGEFTVPCVIESSTDGKDDYGSPTESWATYWTGRAKFETRYGSERAQSNGVDHLVTAIITIRYASGILPDMRVVLDGTDYFNIKYIDNVERANKYLKITIQQAVDVG